MKRISDRRAVFSSISGFMYIIHSTSKPLTASGCQSSWRSLSIYRRSLVVWYRNFLGKFSRKSGCYLRLIQRTVLFYIHGSVYRESNLITVQQDATVFSFLYFCRQFCMSRVLTPIIRSSYNCNYSFWYWSTAMNKVRCY